MPSEEQLPPIEEDKLETGGESPQDGGNSKPAKEFLRQRAERFEFSVLAAEDDDDDLYEGGEAHIVRRRQSLKPKGHQNLLEKAQSSLQQHLNDPFYDLPEAHKVVLEVQGVKKVRVPSLLECRSFLSNEEMEAHKKRSINPIHMVVELLLNIVAAFTIWLIQMITLETVFVVLNSAGAAYYFAERRADWALKLDFAFLAFAVVFPLTFLIQSTFARREQALSFLADFKSSLLNAALMKLTVDWPNKNGGLNNGRLALPKRFNTQVVKDSREFIKLIYEYLSMPQVSHARNHIFLHKQRATKRIHALQNGIVQDINDYMYHFSMHTEEMKKHCFPSGEASRLHQYHQYIQQRWEHLREFKYYRTPQATRSFGRFYILILPWLAGPYWAWMAEGTAKFFAILSSIFTSLVLLGLLNAQQGLEDPFLANYNSFLPGIDTIKLDFELAVTIQAIEQYYANAELKRAWELSQLNARGGEGGKKTTDDPLPEIREETQESLELDWESA